MSKLRFDAAQVSTLLDHAEQATEHREVSEWSVPAGAKRAPQILFVKDDGIYLMSNGVPTADVVYARGYDPRNRDVWEKCRQAVGGDDFAEYFDTADLRPVPSNAVALTIHVTASDLRIGWECGR